MSQDALDDRRLVNQRHEAQPPTATRTGQDVEAKRPPHQLGPPDTRQPGSAVRSSRSHLPPRKHRLRLRSPERSRLATPRARPEHRSTESGSPAAAASARPAARAAPVVRSAMCPAIRPAAPQRQPDLALTGPVQPLLARGRLEATVCAPGTSRRWSRDRVSPARSVWILGTSRQR